MIIFLYCLATFMLIAWIATPLVFSAGADNGDQLLDERLQGLKKALRELRENIEKGDVGKKDAANIERRLILEIAKIYQAMGIEPDNMKDSSCRSCGKPLADNHVYCPACGSKTQAA